MEDWSKMGLGEFPFSALIWVVLLEGFVRDLPGFLEAKELPKTQILHYHPSPRGLLGTGLPGPRLVLPSSGLNLASKYGQIRKSMSNRC